MLNKDISAKKKPTRIFTFTKQKWLLFASLLENGYSIEDSMHIMNVYDVNIKMYLDKGIHINTLLLQGQKGKFYNHLSFFIQFMSLPKAIYSAYEIELFEMDTKKKLSQKCIYPLFILCVSMVSIFLFSTYLIPQLISNFEVNEYQIYIYLVSLCANICKFIIYVSLCILILYVLIYINNKFHLYMYKTILYKFNIFKVYISYFLSGYLQELNKHGLSSIQTFTYLNNMQQHSFIKYLVHDINEQLFAGERLNEIVLNSKVLDDDFKMFFSIGYQNSDLNKSLIAYKTCAEMKWQKKISLISLSIQILSYSMVGILLVCVYQIMLIPLNILEQM